MLLHTFPCEQKATEMLLGIGWITNTSLELRSSRIPGGAENTKQLLNMKNSNTFAIHRY